VLVSCVGGPTWCHRSLAAPSPSVQVVQKLKTLQADAESIVEFLSNENLVKQLKQDKGYNLKFLQEDFNIGLEQIEALCRYAKFQFECGNYSGASEFLYHYRSLCTNSERLMSALWGKVASEILMQNWDVSAPPPSRVSCSSAPRGIPLRAALKCFFRSVTLGFGLRVSLARCFEAESLNVLGALSRLRQYTPLGRQMCMPVVSWSPGIRMHVGMHHGCDHTLRSVSHASRVDESAGCWQRHARLVLCCAVWDGGRRFVLRCAVLCVRRPLTT
jgi:eIF3 subunit 6 N terminal domain